jgi:phosphoribosyl 1,2-cyclic phosphodiesterase
LSLELCILASGSSGNSTILRTPDGVMLIDAGIGPRTTAKRMVGTGVSVVDVRAICLTHLDRDHFTPTWVATIKKLGIRLFCHESRASELKRFVEEIEVGTFNGQPFEPIENVSFRAIRLAHDEMGSHGFIIEGFGRRIGYATDLGRVPPALLDRFCGVDLLALESNYDPEMELNSPRPYFLKQRIMGGSGHLSNQQAFTAVRAILDRCESHARRLPQHIVLLHRSRECNCPKLLRELFETDRRIAPRLTLAEQYKRSEWLGVRDRRPLIGEQLCFEM